MAICSLQTLLTDANSNLFTSVGEATQRALFLQLLCELTAAVAAQTDSYTLHASSKPTIALSPADSTTYYFGYTIGAPPQTIDTSGRMRVPKTGIVTSFAGSAQCSGLGSGEPVQFFIRNQTTGQNSASGPVFFTSTINRIEVQGLTLPVTAGDLILVGFTTPVWVTNPLTMFFMADIFIES